MRDILLRHSFADSGKNRFINVERSLASEAHQFEFVGSFARPAGDGDGISGHVFKPRSCSAQVIGIREINGFFDAEPPGSNTLIGQSGCGELRWTFIFLPYADFDREAQLFSQAAFFEGRADEDRFAHARQDESNEAFTQAPANTSEVVKRRSRSEEESVKLGFSSDIN